MGSEYIGPSRDPRAGQRGPSPSERFNGPRVNDPASSSIDGVTTQPLPAHPSTPVAPPAPGAQQDYRYREHVSGMLYVPPSEAPKFRPAYHPYPYHPSQRYAGPPYPSHQQALYGYYPGYAYPPYYPYYGYAWPPQKRGRSTYELTVAIISFIGSILAILAGGANVLLLIFLLALPHIRGINAEQSFSAIAQFTAFAAAGLVGGGFSLYHSIRALFLKKPSAEFRLPWFWIFLVLYLAVLGIGAWLRTKGLAVANLPLTIGLILLAGIFPVATFLALGVRRVHYPRKVRWPTTWRRFTLSLASGATLAILLALIFEFILTFIAARQFGLTNIPLDNPDQPIPNNPRAIAFLFVLVSVIAPIVEEAVKPLAVVLLIGRIRGAAEAFILGMAAGTGFALVETTGYIGMGYKDWLDVAVQRSTAGLLHGFGAGMVALGWYLITHPGSTRKSNRVLLAVGCWCYALLQHAIWNGSSALQLLPAPIGPYLDKGTIAIGSLKFPSFLLVYVGLSLLMLIFFLYVTRKLRAPTSSPTPATTQASGATLQTQEPRIPVRT